MSKKEKEQINAYLNLLGATAAGINPATTTVDKSLNIVDKKTGEVLIKYGVLTPQVQTEVRNVYHVEEIGSAQLPGDFEPVNEIQEASNDFEVVNQRPIFPDFWSPQKGENKIGWFLGKTREIPDNNGNNKKHWLFAECDLNGAPSGNYFQVNSWATMKDFEKEPENGNAIYKLHYNGLVEREKGNAFHSVTISRKNLQIARPLFPVNLLTCDY